MIAKMTDGAKNLGDNGTSTYTVRTDSTIQKKIQNNSPSLPPKIVTPNHFNTLIQNRTRRMSTAIKHAVHDVSERGPSSAPHFILTNRRAVTIKASL